MELILWIILGGIAGWLASVFMHTDATQGMFGDILLGIVGALIGGGIMSFFGQPGVTGFNFYSLIVAVIGAAIVIGFSRMVSRA